MEGKKINQINCPKCGKVINQVIEGDLDSGWSGGKWGEGTYSEGVITVSYDCPYCKDVDADVIVND